MILVKFHFCEGKRASSSNKLLIRLKDLAEKILLPAIMRHRLIKLAILNRHAKTRLLLEKVGTATTVRIHWTARRQFRE